MIRRLLASAACGLASVLLLGHSWWSWLLAVLGGVATYWHLARKDRAAIADGDDDA